MIFTDHLGRFLSLDRVPNRIISLVPSQTELLVDLGLEDKLVGVTKFCVHPEYLRKTTTVVGGTKTIKLDKIKNLKPDLILCNKEENTPQIISDLENIAPVHISDVISVEDALRLIKDYGEMLNCSTGAVKLIDNICQERHKFQNRYSKIRHKKVVYFIWKDPWMVAANDTFINSMMEDIGLENVFKTYTRYPEIDLQNNYLKQADYIFLSSEPFPFKENHLTTLRMHYPQAEVVLVNGEFFSWFGSKVLHSYEYFGMLFDILQINNHT